MRIIDFHSHYYPPAYLDALRSGSSTVEVTVDDEGNPLLHYPGDYNIAVPGHRDIEYREQALAGDARGGSGHGCPVRRPGERCVYQGEGE
jgi:aminocarboxymuconate-semialdehyde decarboxylase